MHIPQQKFRNKSPPHQLSVTECDRKTGDVQLLFHSSTQALHCQYIHKQAVWDLSGLCRELTDGHLYTLRCFNWSQSLPLALWKSTA